MTDSQNARQPQSAKQSAMSQDLLLYRKDFEVIRKRGCPIQIVSKSNHEGVMITLDRKEQALRVSGWYDSMVGIPEIVVPLELIRSLMRVK